MTTKAPKMGSQIILPPLGDGEEAFRRTIAARDAELAERIEELDDLVENLGLWGEGFYSNLVGNAGFEILGGSTTFDEWYEYIVDNGVVSVDVTNPHAGLQCAAVDSGGGTGTYIRDTISTPGTGVTYSLQVFSRCNGTDPGRIEVRQDGGAILAIMNCVTSSEWALTSATFTTVSNNDVAVRLWCPNLKNRVAYFDDVLVMPSITYAGLDAAVGQLARVIAQILGVW